MTSPCQSPASLCDPQRSLRLDPHAAYFCRYLSRNFLLSAVTSQALGQKQRSTHHQSLGTPQLTSSGMILSKLSLPLPNGAWVLVLCSLSVPSESMRCRCVILPFNLFSSSSSPPGRVSLSPTWLEPTVAHMWAWHVSKSTPKFGLFMPSRTRLTRLT